MLILLLFVTMQPHDNREGQMVLSVNNIIIIYVIIYQEKMFVLRLCLLSLRFLDLGHGPVLCMPII